VIFIRYSKFIIVFLVFIVGIFYLNCDNKNNTEKKQSGKEQAETDNDEDSIQGIISVENEIETFNLEEYAESGEKKWEMEAAAAKIYEDVINLTDVSGVAYGEDIEVNIKARKGKYNKKSQDIHLSENVAIASDGITMMTDKLNWEAENEQAYTDSEVLVKNEKIEIFGKGAWTKPDLKKIRFENEIIANVKPDTIILCEGPLQVEYESNFAVFNKNVIVNDRRGRIWADKMTVYFNSDKEIKRIVAEGNVKIKRGRDITLSKKAEYIAEENKIIFTGNPRLLVYPKGRQEEAVENNKEE